MITNRSLSIIIANYNGEELLKTFMPSVLEATKNYKGISEVIIVDDLSTDNSREVLDELKARHSNIQVIYHSTNLGFSGTCNTGIKAAQGEVLFFLNNDVKLKPDFFHHFNSYFDQPDTFAVTVRAYRYADSLPLDGIKPGKWKRGMPKITQNIFYEDLGKTALSKPFLSFAVQGAYFFADAKKMHSLEGFDELFSPYLFEETDLSYRALKRGWKIYYEPECVAWHAVSSTISKKNKRKTRIISTKNKLVFVWKNIHSGKLLVSHFLFLGLRLLSINLIYWSAFTSALIILKGILQKRNTEQKAAILKDTFLFKKYNF